MNFPVVNPQNSWSSFRLKVYFIHETKKFRSTWKWTEETFQFASFSLSNFNLNFCSLLFHFFHLDSILDWWANSLMRKMKSNERQQWENDKQVMEWTLCATSERSQQVTSTKSVLQTPRSDRDVAHKRRFYWKLFIFTLIIRRNYMRCLMNTKLKLMFRTCWHPRQHSQMFFFPPSIKIPFAPSLKWNFSFPFSLIKQTVWWWWIWGISSFSYHPRCRVHNYAQQCFIIDGFCLTSCGDRKLKDSFHRLWQARMERLEAFVAPYSPRPSLQPSKTFP